MKSDPVSPQGLAALRIGGLDFQIETPPDLDTLLDRAAASHPDAVDEIPYYAIISGENNALYAKYRALADALPGLHLLGRLAEYQYYNMDAIAARALELADGLLQDQGN